MKSFGGPVLFLDRSDINTDEIIPAKYLTEISKQALKPYCLEDLKLEGFDAKRDVETHIKEHMKLRREECVISNDAGIPPTTEPLYIYDALNNTACKLSRHQVMLRKYYAQHIDGKRLVVLPVHYCETCNRYMIGSLSLSLFRGFCGKFLVSTIGVGTDGSREWTLQGESKLHQLGYNVVAGQLSPAERKSILISIVESKQLTFFEVIATIEQDIRIFENNKRMQNAVEKWRSDLQFINEYMISKK